MSVAFAGLTVDPDAHLLLMAGRAPIALGTDQARTLQLLMQGGGDGVEVARIEQETVNPTMRTVESLNCLLRSVGGLSAIVHDRATGLRLVDATTDDLGLAFADLRLIRAARSLLVADRAPITVSPQNTAVLGRLMQAGGAPVAGHELQRVLARTAPGAAVGNLSRRLRTTRTRVRIVNERSCGWRLVG